MARRLTLALAALAVMIGIGASTVGVATVEAQPGRTAPPAIDLTCYGYDEGATRAYNCIPEPSQQHHMRTFVPPVGSACDAGSIAEFPAGRIVFQIRCRDGSRGQTAAWSHWGRGPASFDMPEDASERFWVHTAFSGSSVHFVVRCRAPQQRVVVNELLGRSWGNSGTNGIYGMAGCREVEVDTGGQDLQWWFTQELAATALMPPQSWEQVTGAGGALPAQALQDLAGAVDLERLDGPPSQWGIQPPMDANDRAALRTSDAEGIFLSGLIASRPDDRTYALDRASVRGATTRTVPLTLDLTCHGYIEAAGTRAYNCIPEPSQQHHMRTFVPPVGSACDAGNIAEFPRGRIVFQIRCRDADMVMDDHGNNFANSTPLLGGQTVRSRDRAAFDVNTRGSLETETDVDVFRLDFGDLDRCDLSLLVQTRGSTDTEGRLFVGGEWGSEFIVGFEASDDDSGDGLNFRIDYTYREGSCCELALIEVRGYDGAVTGRYELSVSVRLDGFPCA